MLARWLGYVSTTDLSHVQAAAEFERRRADDLAARLELTERRLWSLVEQRLFAAKDIRVPLSPASGEAPRPTGALGSIAMTELPTTAR
jgi:hypothetical protein